VLISKKKRGNRLSQQKQKEGGEKKWAIHTMDGDQKKPEKSTRHCLGEKRHSEGIKGKKGKEGQRPRPENTNARRQGEKGKMGLS